MQMDDPEARGLILPSQGIHLVVDKRFFPGANAMMIPKTDDKRVLFAVPWHNKVVLGTTDTPVDEISFEPVPMEEEIEFVLQHANRYLDDVVTRRDVRSVFAGLRPLVKRRGAKNTSMLSRDHTIIVSKAGLITITGGKWTTYRKMAEDAIDNAIFVARLPKRDCITRTLPIGSRQQGDGGRFISSPAMITENDIRHFVDYEMALTVEDVLARRTRLLFLDAYAAADAAEGIARTMAAVMKRDEQWIKGETAAFTNLARQYCLG
jgi:glycerol-3-phosphate dehydrogenase